MFGVSDLFVPLREGTVVGGTWRVLGPLGEPPGHTWAARGGIPDEGVAVKVLAALPGPKEIPALEAIFASWQAVGHAGLPGLRRIWVEQVDGVPVVLMARDLVEGDSLEARVRKGGPLGEEAARNLAISLLEILGVLAAADPPLLHGDLNPHNVLLAGGRPMLVDPGSFKAAARELGLGGLGGSGWAEAVDRSHAAPEQMLGDPHPTSDLYALGNTILFAVTGKAPRELPGGDGLEKALTRLGVRRPFQQVLERLREFDCDRRFASPGEALRAFRGEQVGPDAPAVVRRTPVDAQEWVVEPLAGPARAWVRQRLLLGAGVLAPLLAGTPLLATQALPGLPAPASVGSVALAALGLLLAGWFLVFELPRRLRPAQRRLAAWSADLRYTDEGGSAVSVPFRRIESVRRVGRMVAVTGTWDDPFQQRGERRRVLWLAPVYDIGPEDLEERIQEIRSRSPFYRPGLDRAGSPPSALPTNAVVLALGVALGLLAARGVWDDSAGGGTGRPAPPPAVAVTADGDDDGLAMGGYSVPSEGNADPDSVEAEIRALTAYQDAMRKVTARLPKARLADGEVAPGGEAAPTGGDVDLEVRPVPVAPVDGGAKGGGGLPARDCPSDMRQRTLALASMLPPACADEHGTMLQIHPPGEAPFLLDWTEVTAAAWEQCVAAEACLPRRQGTDCNDAATRPLHPANCLDRSQAAAYCAWAGRRLCSAREWEAGAWGGEEGAWPWGTAQPDCVRAVMVGRTGGSPIGPGCGRGSTWPAGTRLPGASPQGALDMAGNVAEWVADDPSQVRGGGFDAKEPASLLGSTVSPLPAGDAPASVGLRCCRPL